MMQTYFIMFDMMSSFLGDNNYDKKNNDSDNIGLDLEHRLVKCG